MLRLPTDRSGWLVLLVASANLAVNGTILSLVVVNKPAIVGLVWRDLVAAHLPAALILLAAVLAGRSRPAYRYPVVAFGLLAFVGELCFLDAWLGGPAASVVGTPVIRAGQHWLAMPPRSYAIATAALVPAAVGWWRNRRDRVAE